MAWRDVLNASWLSYYVSRSSDAVEKLFDRVVQLEDLYVGISQFAQIATAANGLGWCAVVGLCVDSRGEVRPKDLPAYLLSNTLEEVLLKNRRLAGSYVLIEKVENRIVVIPDACSLLPCYYSPEGDLSVSDFLIARIRSFREDGLGRQIRDHAPIGKALLHDYTPYAEVKALLPNHFLEYEAGTAVRYSPYDAVKCEVARIDEIEQIAAAIYRSSTKTFKEYHTAMPGYPVAAITAGWDSRLNYSILKHCTSGLKAFTFVHNGFAENTPDYAIPLQLCKQLKQEHVFLEDQPLPPNALEAIRDLYGSNFDPATTVDLAYTFAQAFPEGYLLSGHIIDGIGKNHVCNAVPLRLATPRFFQEKAYNASKAARKAAEEWIDDVDGADDGRIICDLFSIENRIARWVTQATSLYSYLNVPVVDIFNCQETIALMMRVPRAKRAHCSIHRAIFEQYDPALLKINFNGTGKVLTRFKSSWPYSIAKTRIQYNIALRKTTRMKQSERNGSAI